MFRSMTGAADTKTANPTSGPRAGHLAGRVADWLVREGPTREPIESLLDGVCRRLVEAGVPVWRLNYVTQVLHPLSRYTNFRWYADRDEIERTARPHGSEQGAQFLNSPIRSVFDGAGEMRRKLEGPDAILDFPILHDLLAQSATDYAVFPLRFSDGQTNAITVATRKPGGFGDSDLEELRSTARALAPHLEIRLVRGLSSLLLDTYIGPHAGTRVLNGAITRGSSETIHAVVWYCDLHDFTALSERIPRDYLMWVLNDFFEAMCGPVEDQGGDTLKFIGDAVLAVFRVRSGGAAEACARALTATTDAQKRMIELNERRRGEGKPELRYRIALHIGDVLFGNIGAPKRLDFTVIGPAVNLVSRIAGLSETAGRPVLVSADFAEAATTAFDLLGAFDFKGVADKQKVFVPA